jgi:hypothetical protein
METAKKSGPGKLADYIRSLPNFVMYSENGESYGHIGATLADAVLQANSNYELTVRKRVANIRKEYSNETSLGALNQLLKKVTIQDFLQWNGTRKPETFLRLVSLLQSEGVNTEDDLREWLQRDDSGAKLRNIPSVGPKTVDYLKILVGLSEAAIDRHMLNFIDRAGLGKMNYEQAKELIHQTADLMKLDRANLDHSIWRYMSGDETDAVDK